MTYSGKHARPGGTGSRRGPGGPVFRPVIPRPARKAEPLDEVGLDDLQAEDALDRDGHRDLQRLLGSIHMRGIRLQSPVYIARSRPVPGPGNSPETRQEPVPWRARRRPDDTVPLVKCDTVPLLKV